MDALGGDGKDDAEIGYVVDTSRRGLWMKKDDLEERLVEDEEV